MIGLNRGWVGWSFLRGLPAAGHGLSKWCQGPAPGDTWFCFFSGAVHWVQPWVLALAEVVRLVGLGVEPTRLEPTRLEPTRQLEPKWLRLEPKWLRSRTAPRRPQDLPRRPRSLRRPRKTPRTSPRTPQDPPYTPPVDVGCGIVHFLVWECSSKNYCVLQ